MLFNRHEVHIGEYSSRSWFASIWTEPLAKSINLQKNERDIFSSADRASQFNELFIIMMALFNLLTNWCVPVIFSRYTGARKIKNDKHLVTFLTSFLSALNWICPPNMKVKWFVLTKKLFILCDELKTQFAEFSSWTVHLSGPYCKIWNAQETNQNSPFHSGPIQPYNKVVYGI